MKLLINLLFLTALLPFTANAGRLQDADFKSLSELQAAGGTAAQLLNDTKIYVSSSGIADTLANAITNGAIGGSGAGSGVELLTNPGFEKVLTQGWTSSGGTFTRVSSGANLLFDKYSATFTATAAGQYVRSTAIAVPVGLQNTSCLARGYLFAGDANYKVQVVDGTGTVLAIGGQNAELVTKAQTVATPYEIGFRCPSAGSVSVQVISTAAGALVALDNFHLGSEDRFFRADTYGLIAEGYIPGTSGCSFTTTSTTFVNATAAGCPAPIVTTNPGPGTIAASTGVFAVTASNIPEGTYQVDMWVPLQANAAGAASYARITDGTTNSPGEHQLAPSSGQGSPTQLRGYFTYSSLGTRTFQLQLRASGGNSFGAYASSADVNFQFAIHRVSSVGKNLYIQTQAPNDLSIINDFNASVSTAGAVTQPNAFINGSCTYDSGAGRWTCPFVSNVFTVAPICEGNSTGGVGYMNIVSTSATSVVLATTLYNGAQQYGFNIHCQKASPDYKARSVILGQISNASQMQRQRFSTSGTFTVPSNIAANTAFKVTVVGAGGSGGYNNGNVPTGGGGAGGWGQRIVTGLAAGSTVTVTVGTAGAAQATNATAGNSGGQSSFGTFCIATGGVGGSGTGAGQGGLGGSFSACDDGGGGGAGGAGAALYSYGAMGGIGGNSMFGGGGQPGASDNGQITASPGVSCGAGGGGMAGTATGSSGAGANGCVIVEWVQ